MANGSKQNAVSSMTSVISSIENDRQVYRWFLILISLPVVQNKLSLQQKTKDKYHALKSTQIAEIITYLVLALLLYASCMFKQSWVLFWGIAPILVLVNLYRKNRGYVAGISEAFLSEHIPMEQLTAQTLYQTCEYLSREYTIPSLVDIITFQDFIGRKVLIGTVLLLPFISHFKGWQIWTVTFSVFLLTLAIVNTSIVLKKLK